MAEPLSFRVTRQLGRWLSRWGVDADQYHWLLQASLRMDFRTRSSLQPGQQSRGTKSALIMTGVMYMVFSLMLAGSLRAAGVGTLFYSTVLFGYAMLMMAMAILMEFGQVVISPDDFLILAHRPISSRTFFAVKCSNLLFYTLLLDLSLNVLPALVGWTLGVPWYFPLLYLAVAALAGVFVAAAVAGVYGLLLKRVNYERFKDLLAWCQIVFSFIFFFGYQLAPRVLGRVHDLQIEQTPWGLAAALPPIWFGSLVELGLGNVSVFVVVLGGIGVVALILLVPGLLRSVSLDYADRIGGMMAAAVTRGAVKRSAKAAPGVSWLERVLIRDQEERALFHFLLKMLRRNRQLKMQLYPNFGVVLALFFLAVLDHEKMTDPLAGGGASFALILPLMVFLFAGMGFTAVLPYSDEHEGGWIFFAAPIRRADRLLKAIKKAALLVLFIPLFVLLTVLFSFLWPVTHALGISLYGLTLGLVVFQVVLFWFRDFPFSRKMEKGAQSRRMGIVIAAMFAYGICMGLLNALAAVPMLLPVAVVVLGLAALALGALNNRAYARAVSQLEP
jgi:ABC-2 type transport system permease protein